VMVIGQNTFFSKDELEKAFGSTAPSKPSEDSDSPQ